MPLYADVILQLFAAFCRSLVTVAKLYRFDYAFSIEIL